MREEWITGLLGVLGIFGLVIREYIMVFLCAVLLLARYASRAWTQWSLAHLSYRRELSSLRAWPGERVRLTIEIENDTLVPIPFLECQDEFPEGIVVEKGRLLGHHKQRRRILYNLLGLRWYERIRRHYHLSGDHRGRFLFGPVELMTGDLLGLASHSGRQETTVQLLVYPRIYAMDDLPVVWRSPSGTKTIRSWLLEDPTLYGGTREYTSRDPFNRIEWKASARSQQLKVRIFDASVDRALMIALNLSTHDRPWEGVDLEVLEWSISVAASIASGALESGHGVGLITNHYQVPTIESVRGPEQATRILDTLAAIDLLTTWPTPGIVPRSLTQVRTGESLILVTPRLDEALVVELRGAVSGSNKRPTIVYTGAQPPVELGEVGLAWIPKEVSGDEISQLG